MNRFEAAGVGLQIGRSLDWLKFKNPNCEAASGGMEGISQFRHPVVGRFRLRYCNMICRPMSHLGQTRSFGVVGSSVRLPESGHGWTKYTP